MTTTSKYLRNGFLLGLSMGGVRAAGQVTGTGEKKEYPTLAPNSTWYRGTLAKNKITEIDFVDTYIPTGNENESWVADVDESGSIMCYASGTVLTISGNGSGKIAANEDSSDMFLNYTRVTAINGLTLLDTSNAIDMSHMFSGCNRLKSLDVSGFDTGKVTNMIYMFYACLALASLDPSNFRTGSVTNMSNMFAYCQALKSLDVSSFDTSKVVNMGNMFYECRTLVSLDISNFDTSEVIEMSGMFSYCKAITAIYVGDGWTTANVLWNTQMFYNCGVSSVTRI